MWRETIHRPYQPVVKMVDEVTKSEVKEVAEKTASQVKAGEMKSLPDPAKQPEPGLKEKIQPKPNSGKATESKK